MPRTTTRKDRGFIWLPREGVITWDLKIDGVSVKLDVLDAEFTKGTIPEVGEFSIQLINADGFYSKLYSQGTIVQFFMDFASGSTKRFEGKIDKLPSRYGINEGYVFNVSGVHYTKDLLDEPVTKSFSGSTSMEDIATEITEEFVADRGFTLDYTATSTKTPTINWDEKPFLDCLNDLRKIAEADVYVDDDKVIHFFDRNSVENNNEAIVWNDTLINLEGLGSQSITTKNKIKVFGDDGTGLPIIRLSNDPTSQGLLGVKTESIFDSNINTENNAQETADAERDLRKDQQEEGLAEAFLLPSLQPGDKIWVTNPPVKIRQQIRVYKFTHKVPIERTLVVIGNQRGTPQIFKKRVENELALKKITNPFNMESTINLKFDSESEVTSKDENVIISGGFIKLNSGSQGSFNVTRNIESMSEVHLRAIGSDLVGTDFDISTDGGAIFQSLNLESKTELTNPKTTAFDVIIRVTLQSATTEIDSLAILYK